MAENSHLIQMEINRYQQGNPFLAQMPDDQRMDKGPDGNNRFNTQIILWSKDGEILNKDVLGGRFTELENLTLDKKNLDSVQSLSLKNTGEASQKLSFHSYTIKAENAENIAYIQFLSNTNQIADSMKTFETTLIICMIIFWLISIGISFYISKMNMQPIMHSWRKQQEFVENASHELRTPLTSIITFAQISREACDPANEHDRRSWEEIEKNSRILLNMINNMLDIARSDAGGMRATCEPMDLGDVAHR